MGRRSDIDWERVERLYVAGVSPKDVSVQLSIPYSTLSFGSRKRGLNKLTAAFAKRDAERENRAKACPGEKFCQKCCSVREHSEFPKNARRKDGLAPYCSTCSKALAEEKQYDAKRWANNRESEQERHRKFMAENSETQLARYKENARKYRKENPAKVNATNRSRSKHKFVPKFADKSAMRMIYEKAKEWSDILGIEMQVDHIVPLRGKSVCGLHCESNLQILEKTLNHQKRHFNWPDMP